MIRKYDAKAIMLYVVIVSSLPESASGEHCAGVWHHIDHHRLAARMLQNVIQRVGELVNDKFVAKHFAGTNRTIGHCCHYPIAHLWQLHRWVGKARNKSMDARTSRQVGTQIRPNDEKFGSRSC